MDSLFKQSFLVILAHFSPTYIYKKKKNDESLCSNNENRAIEAIENLINLNTTNPSENKYENDEAVTPSTSVIINEINIKKEPCVNNEHKKKIKSEPNVNKQNEINIKSNVNNLILGFNKLYRIFLTIVSINFLK